MNLKPNMNTANSPPSPGGCGSDRPNRAGLVQVEVFVRFSVVLVRFMRVRTRLPWVFDEITTPVEKQFGPSPMDGKTERAADPLRENALALLLGDVEEGKVLGAELTRDEVSEVADLRRGKSFDP